MTAEGFQGDKREWLKRSALDAALNNPLRYVESIGVFALKGMWFLQAGGGIFNVVALACFFSLFLGALFTCRQDLVAAFGLPAGLFAFISTFTHALTRYNAAMTPFVIISVLAHRCFRPAKLSPPSSLPEFRGPDHAQLSGAERCEQLEPSPPNRADIERRDRIPRLSGKVRTERPIRHHALELGRERRNTSRLDQNTIFATFQDIGGGAGGNRRRSPHNLTQAPPAAHWDSPQSATAARTNLPARKPSSCLYKCPARQSCR